MSKNQLNIYQTAAEIPDEWDYFANSVFLKRASLQIIEKTNPCMQQYFFSSTETDCSIAVSYRHNLNILTYGSGSLRLPVTIVGIPCSVADPGYNFASDSSPMIIDYLNQLEGAKLVLNSDETTALPGFVMGLTLPSCKTLVEWETFEDYLDAMRSHYRYRYRKALEKWQDISINRLTDNRTFDESLYGLYLNVFSRSRYKLEKLGIDFFKQFPANIDIFEENGVPVGFVQTIRNNDVLMFMFGGMEYNRSDEKDLYINMLLHIIRLGIEGGYRVIDLGQTAEPVKCKLGGRFQSKTLHASHKNRVADFFVKKFIHILSYKAPEKEYRVFR